MSLFLRQAKKIRKIRELFFESATGIRETARQLVAYHLGHPLRLRRLPVSDPLAGYTSRSHLGRSDGDKVLSEEFGLKHERAGPPREDNGPARSLLLHGGRSKNLSILDDSDD
jgi:hypothetical protein